MVVLFLISLVTSIVPSVICEDPLSYISCYMFIGCLFDDSHSDRCELVLHRHFDLHFPDEKRCWTSFHVSAGHLCAFSGKMSVQILCPFFDQVVCFLILNCMCSLYNVFWILTPCQIYCSQIYSPLRFSFSTLKRRGSQSRQNKPHLSFQTTLKREITHLLGSI